MDSSLFTPPYEQLQYTAQGDTIWRVWRPALPCPTMLYPKQQTLTNIFIELCRLVAYAMARRHSLR